MNKSILKIGVSACLILNLAVCAHAFQRGGHGGGGGVRGGGYGGGAHVGPATRNFNPTPSFSVPRYGNPTSPYRSSQPQPLIRGGGRPQATYSGPGGPSKGPAQPAAHGGGHNPYRDYHRDWLHGHWYGHDPGFWGSNGGPGYWAGGPGWGLGPDLGWGLSPWLFGPMLYDWGYASYDNPYYAIANPPGVVAEQPDIYDYSQPISSLSQPPEEAVMTQATSTFDAARKAFKAGDYPGALDLADQSLKLTPNDPAAHEFRALVLFALRLYDQAAAVLYAVLSVGPGWDWTTLISLYADPDTYTQQLRALEDYCAQNPSSAPARFVLAEQYLTEGFPDGAIRQLKNVVARQPRDQLSAQLLQQLEQKEQAGGGDDLAAAASGAKATQSKDGKDDAQNGLLGAAPSGAGATAAPSPPGAPTSAKQRSLMGTWTAQPAIGTTISLTFQDKGHFVWKVSRQGKDQQFGGTSTYDSGILTMVQQPKNDNVMVGNVAWNDDDHFRFKVPRGGPSDPGLSFARRP